MSRTGKLSAAALLVLAAATVASTNANAFKARQVRCDAAQPWLEQTQAPPPSPVAEAAAAAGTSADDDVALDADALAALREALASSRPRLARQRFAQLQAGLGRRYGQALAQTLADQLNALDFPAALHTFDAALSGAPLQSPPASPSSL